MTNVEESHQTAEVRIGRGVRSEDKEADDGPFEEDEVDWVMSV